MDNANKILALLQELQYKEIELSTLNYGSLEVREKNDNKYIYTHVREDGKPKTYYIGEYDEESYNSLFYENIKAKELKKSIRKISEELEKYGIEKKELSISVKRNSDFVRANLLNIIFSQALIEGLSTTRIQTENVINNAKVNNMTAADIVAIVNLKHAWEFVLDKYVISSNTSYYILCCINKIILTNFFYDGGMIRHVPVTITGTSYVPGIPFEADIKDDINNIINSDKSDLDKSMELFLYISRKQMFIDGNKRTALIFANHYLISKGKGLLQIPVEKIDEFKKLLVDYYETGKKSKMKSFLKKYCYTDISKYYKSYYV